MQTSKWIPSKSYKWCINPNCKSRQNNSLHQYCRGCRIPLKIISKIGEYELRRPLRDLKETLYNTELFEAYCHVNKEIVVIKTLIKRNEKNDEMFERERHFLKDILDQSIKNIVNQSGIPRYRDHFDFEHPELEYDKIPCLVIQKIEGDNLNKWIFNNGPISQKEAIEWLIQITKLIQFVHNKGYIHRDLKPSNIILKPYGELVLIDYGTVIDIPSLEDPRTIIYSHQYSPPEFSPEFSDESFAKPTLQSDFFSLGRTFVYLLTKKDLQDIIIDPNNKYKLLWQDLVIEVSRPLIELIDWLMAVRPEKRPETTDIILDSVASLKNLFTTGQTLEEWLKRNPPITQEQALNWLRQLTRQLHKREADKNFSADLRPANIVITPTNDPYDCLKLIDLELESVGLPANKHIYHLGDYAPRKRVSDMRDNLYALGITMIRLTTKKTTKEIDSTWRDRAQWWISDDFANILNALIADNPSLRHCNTKRLLDELDCL